MDMPLTTLMQSFGRFAGLPELEPDEDGSYYLMFDEFVIVIHPASLLPGSAPERQDAALLHACTGLLSRERREHICLRLLNANLFFAGTDGATLGTDSEGLVYLQRVISLSGLDLAGFLPILESFVQQTENWTRICASMSMPPTHGLHESIPSASDVLTHRV